MSGTIKDKVAVITGGASGLGLATVERFLKHGANVVILDFNATAGEEKAKSLGENCTFIHCDVTDDTSVERAIAEVDKQYGRLDILLNNAGIFKTANIESPEFMQNLRATMKVNTEGVLCVIHHALKVMKKTPPDADGSRGVIINPSSITSFQGRPVTLAYSASKGSINSITLPLARSLQNDGIRVVAIAPGMFPTPLIAEWSQAYIEAYQKLPLHPKRLGDVDEFAALVQHVAENKYLNATVIHLDAGCVYPNNWTIV